MDVSAHLHDLRDGRPGTDEVLSPDEYRPGQALGRTLYASGSDGLVYPSVRYPEGQCVALFHPDLAARPVQGRHLDYHWSGDRVDLYRDNGTGQVFRIL